MIRRPVLLYDQDCGFCRWSVGQILRRDRDARILPLAIQSSAGEQFLSAVPPGQRLVSWHLVDADGRLYSGGAVFVPLLRLLDRKGLAWVTARAPGLTSFAYHRVAGRRSLFGPLVSAAAKRHADALIAERAGGERPAPPAAPKPPAPPAPPEVVPAPEAQRAPELVSAPEAQRAPELQPEHDPAPARNPEPEPVGWQQRFEQSPFGRGLLSTLIVVSLIAIVAINLPSSELRRQLLRPGQPYLNATGLDQNWSLFAPNPRRVVIDVSARVVYDDGRTAQWTFPHDDPVVGAYRDYRWRKWEENIIAPVNAAALWRPAALWAASHETRVGHAVSTVALVERYAPLEPPGVRPSTGPAARRIFFVLHLQNGAA